MTISTPHGPIEIAPSDQSYRYKQLMGENFVEIITSRPDYIEVPVGSQVTVGGETYTMLQPQQVRKIHNRNFEITLRFEGTQAQLSKYMYRDTAGGLKFSLTAKLSEHLELLVDNLNQRETGWSFSITDAELDKEKTITAAHNTIAEILESIREAYATEYEIVGKLIKVGKVEYFKADPLPLSYGKGNGFKSGVKRENYTNEKQVAVLFVQGTERNINPQTYGNRYLLMPPGVTFEHLGKTFETDEFGYSIFIQGQNTAGATEGSLDLSDIYPRREGTVSNVIPINAAKNLFDFTDTTIPAELDYNQCRIIGENWLIAFQTGSLAGREFEINQYVHSTRTFKVVPQEYDAVTMPNNSGFSIQPGDKYIILNISMPPAYIRNDADKTGASWEMAKEAAKYLAEHETPRFSFVGEIDNIWAGEIIEEIPRWGTISPKLKIGGYILFTDQNIESEGVAIRITGKKEFLRRPTAPEIELSNVSGAKSIAGALKKVETENVVTKNLFNQSITYAKRGFREAKETSEALQNALLNFGNEINPITVSTMQLLIGDQSLQFIFVDNTYAPQRVEHTVTYNKNTKVLTAPSGIIQHKTIGLDGVRPNRSANDYRYWSLNTLTFDVSTLDPTKYYYLYAQCAKWTSTGAFTVSATGKAMDDGTNYNLLVGVLNSESEGDRNFITLYGFTEVLPGRMTIDKLISQDGDTYIDLLNGIIAGDIRFRTAGGGLKDITQIIGDIKIGGRNLIANSKLNLSSSDYGFGSRIANMEAGTVYTLSARGNTANAQNGKHLKVYIHNIDWSWSKEITITETINTVKSVTFEAPQTGQFTVSAYYFDETNPRTGNVYVDWYKLEKGNKATDWTPAPEDMDLMIAQIEEDVEEAMTEAQNANSSISGLNTYVDNAFRDGVISQAEAQAIAKYTNEINAAKERINREYLDLYNNTYLTGTAKTNLLNSKTTLFGAIDTLLASIQTAIADAATTTAEKNDVDAKYQSYITALGDYTTKVGQAGKAIQDRLNELSINAVLDLEIGGENLYNGNNLLSISSPGGSTPTITRNTANTPNGFEIISSSGGYLTEARISNVIRSNGHHVVSCQIRITSGTAQVNIDIADNHAALVNVDTEWKRVHAVANVQNFSESIYNFVDIQTTDYRTIQVKDFMVQRGNKATDYRKSAELLLEAMQGTTDIYGGVLLTNLILLKNQQGNNTGGISGIAGDKVASWFGGNYNQALEDADKQFMSPMTTAGLDKKDGSGHRAFGNLAWDALGNTYLAGVIQALAGGKIGQLEIFENTLSSTSMAFSETPVETLASLLSPSSAWITYQNSWDDTGFGRRATASTQAITLTLDSTLKFRATCTPGSVTGGNRRWYVLIYDANYNIVFSQSGSGSISAQLFSVKLPAGSYQIYAEATTGIDELTMAYNTASVTGELAAVIYAYSYASQTKIGSDGFYSFWNSERYIYFKSDYGFEGRWGNIGLRFITGQSSPQKMVSGAWTNL